MLFEIAKRLDKSFSSTKVRYLLAPNNSSQREFCINQHIFDRSKTLNFINLYSRRTSKKGGQRDYATF